MTAQSVHERILPAEASRVGELIDDIEAIWPSDRWGQFGLDRPLGVGAESRRRLIRERVVEYRPGHELVFRLTRPDYLDGEHRFEVEPVDEGRTRLRHVLTVAPHGNGRLLWPLVVHPLHDALLEDLLDRAESSVGGRPRAQRWSPRVRFLRWLLGRRR